VFRLSNGIIKNSLPEVGLQQPHKAYLIISDAYIRKCQVHTSELKLPDISTSSLTKHLSECKNGLNVIVQPIEIHNSSPNYNLNGLQTSDTTYKKDHYHSLSHLHIKCINDLKKYSLVKSQKCTVNIDMQEWMGYTSFSIINQICHSTELTLKISNLVAGRVDSATGMLFLKIYYIHWWYSGR